MKEKSLETKILSFNKDNLNNLIENKATENETFSIPERTQEHITIAILGPVSAGKSTFFNAISSNTCSDMQRRKTTMLPQYYHITKSDSAIDSIEDIYQRNKQSNEHILQLRESGQFNHQRDFVEIHHSLKEIKDFIELPDPNATFSILDMPGLNCGGDDLYYKYTRENSQKIDIYVLVFDINNGMNTNDEVQILQLVAEQVRKNNYGYVHIIMNKCDEINFDDQEAVTLGDEELDELFCRCRETVDKHMSGIDVSITPMSSSKLYVYRGVKNNIQSIDESHLDNIIKTECGRTELRKLTTIDKKRSFVQV